MFSGFLIGLLAAISAATWVYTVTLRRTGGNNKSSITTGLIAGIIVLIVVITIVATIDSYLSNK